MAFSKLCKCCQRVHDARSWLGLPFAGPPRLRGFQPCGEGEPGLVLRNCPCGTTLAVDEPDEVKAEAERREREASYMRGLLLGLRARVA
jgi:hypothetical protein